MREFSHWNICHVFVFSLCWPKQAHCEGEKAIAFAAKIHTKLNHQDSGITMLCQHYVYFYLDILHALTSLPITLVSSYLLYHSYELKLKECKGYYKSCSLGDYDKNVKVDEKGIKLIDWITISQSVLIVFISLTVILGAVSTFTRNRRLSFVVIIFYLVHLIQLGLIQASDDRDFPRNIFRDGYSLGQYALIFTAKTQLFLILKCLYVFLILFDMILLIVSFVSLRYHEIYSSPMNDIL